MFASVRALTGGHESNIEGGVTMTGPREMFGSVKVSSSLKWDSHPIEISFKQVRQWVSAKIKLVSQIQ